jgi:membrane-bound ClpP family serine protease
MEERKFAWFDFLLCCVALLIGLTMLRNGLINNSDYEKTKVKRSVDSIQRHSDSLIMLIATTEQRVNRMKMVIDSLENVKPQIVVKYVKKYKEIDSASAGTVVTEFDSIFSKGLGK